MLNSSCLVDVLTVQRLYRDVKGLSKIFFGHPEDLRIKYPNLQENEVMAKILVHETFQQTIQGEGHWVGTPCDFIRLHGCPIHCRWCDTGYSSTQSAMMQPARSVDIDELVAETKSKLVVISGGEPFIHVELPVLVDKLMRKGCNVSIETSGAFYQEIRDDAWVTLSPKEHLNSRYPVNPKMLLRANEIKIVITDGAELEFYRDKIGVVDVPVYLQPEWNSRDKSLPIAIHLANQYSLKLSVQVHKFVGVR